MWRKLVQQFRALFRREPRKFNFDPVMHRLNPHPVLPQGMMSAIAPAYEEALNKDKGEKAPQEPQWWLISGSGARTPPKKQNSRTKYGPTWYGRISRLVSSYISCILPEPIV